ncbi:MAG: hypothetical protein MZV64_49395 [Ignavibacteriales bacterium]|nr:hypothetical protein [Ignavibacteriales bacterium]
MARRLRLPAVRGGLPGRGRTAGGAARLPCRALRPRISHALDAFPFLSFRVPTPPAWRSWPGYVLFLGLVLVRPRFRRPAAGRPGGPRPLRPRHRRRRRSGPPRPISGSRSSTSARANPS